VRCALRRTPEFGQRVTGTNCRFLPAEDHVNSGKHETKLRSRQFTGAVGEQRLVQAHDL
jgi:hypothetical protein